MHFTHCVDVTLPNNCSKLPDFHEMLIKCSLTFLQLKRNKEGVDEFTKTAYESNSIGAGSGTCAGPCKGHFTDHHRIHFAEQTSRQSDK